MTSVRLAVLISGNGSNLQALIDAAANGTLHGEICVVVSNREQAFGLQRAQRANIPNHVLAHDEFESRAAFDQALLKLLDGYSPDLIALAGFMRVLGGEFVEHYAGRILNVHPSLLPRFPGLDTHARALRAGAREHGASIHFVTEELDAGPVVIQGRVAVRENDTEAQLAERVHEVEHRIYPAAVAWFAQGRLSCEDQRAWFDGQPLHQPKLL
ncbi:MAG: phosphoribosylglycinamide formyltransferase [Gammaproteobacteria bacterium]|nr:phosphoribosylglycinamide formyltransferase [Gammaproteobacteria bacterium]